MLAVTDMAKVLSICKTGNEQLISKYRPFPVISVFPISKCAFR